MKKWLPWVVCLLGTSCVHPPRKAAVAPVLAPDHWAATSQANEPVRAEWWESFGDSNLAATVEIALRRNHDLQTAAARLDAAAAEAEIAGADLTPHADLNFQSQRRQQNFVGFPIPGAGNRVLTTRSTVHNLAFNFTWEADLWGRVRAGKKAALADWQASAEDLRGARLSLAAQAAKSWLAVAESTRQLELARATAESYSTTAQQVRDRYEQGLRSPLDLRLALTSEANARALVAQRENERQTAVRRLETLLGEYPAGTFAGADVLPEVPAEIPAGLPSELLDRRPDLVAAERRLAGAEARVWEAKAALFPRISLTASGGRSSDELADLLSHQFTIWSLAGNLAQPLFEGGRLWAGVKLAKARAREALENYAGTILQAFQEVETRLAAEDLLRRRETELNTAVEQARAAQALAEDRYRSGLEDFVTLLEAQRRALDTEAQLLAVRRQRLENRVDLHLALGGGFGEAEPEMAAWKGNVHEK